MNYEDARAEIYALAKNLSDSDAASRDHRFHLAASILYCLEASMDSLARLEPLAKAVNHCARNFKALLSEYRV